MTNDYNIENGVAFGSGSAITFSCSYDMSDQTLESDAFGVTTDKVSFDGMYTYRLCKRVVAGFN